jgi:hypothetical protein
LIGATIIGSGAGFVGLKSQQATALKVGQELIVALTAEAVFGGGVGNVLFQALTLDEHEEALGQLVGGRDGQSAHRASELMGVRIELERITHEDSIGGNPTCV